ncbi:MAG: GNAT family N-acetyltransferase [Clostridia bacterium]|nr:GNAT family N-acetyltransferase [Clostridia bacterium]
MDRLYLKFPTVEDKQNVLDYKNEFLTNGQKMSGVGGLDRLETFEAWLQKVNSDISKETCEQGRVPSTLYLVYRIQDNKLVGMMQIRHELNERLLKHGGHIGDSIRPSEQGKGYGTEQIKLALQKCKIFGIKKVLITCDKSNIASARTIQKNNGVLENEIVIDGTTIQRYWIDLTNNQQFTKPDWQQSNLNISATLAEFLNAPNKNVILPLLKNELKKGYKNVVFICFDGMGINPLSKNLEPNDFLIQNIKQNLTSTFPSTTTNATTALITNKYPLEHGWFGWSLYFDEINRNIDIYLQSDSQTGEKVDYKYPIMDNSNCYFEDAKTDYQITTLLPIYVKTNNPDNKIVIQNEYDLCESIKQVCARENKQFIYAYLPEPDATMHEFGVTSEQAKQRIKSINNQIEKLFNQLTNTIIVITADHGQIDVSDCIEFYKDKELNELLEYTPFLDARTPAFIVKNGKEKEFETKFDQKYGQDFKLFKSKDLIEQGYFGNCGDYGYLLGDYIAIGTYTNKLFISHKNMMRFKGHHTSLTDEMLVPLIILSKK